MINFIQKATEEFEQNGRSAKFIEMEKKIIKGGKPLQMYYFARYARGADVARFQQEMIQNGNLELCYYFQQNVKGSNMRTFVKYVVETGDRFWLAKFIELAKKTKKHHNIYDLISDFEYEAPNKSQKIEDVNGLIEFAQEEYTENGRSKTFVDYEKMALYSPATSKGMLFAKEVNGVNIKNFERTALLKGDPFYMYLLATEVPGVDKSLMLNGLNMAKLDYNAMDNEKKGVISRKQSLLKYRDKATEPSEAKKYQTLHDAIEYTNEYVAKINGDYIPRVQYLIKAENSMKK